MSIFCDILNIIELSLYNSIIFLLDVKFLLSSFLHCNYQDTILNWLNIMNKLWYHIKLVTKTYIQLCMRHMKDEARIKIINDASSRFLYMKKRRSLKDVFEISNSHNYCYFEGESKKKGANHAKVKVLSKDCIFHMEIFYWFVLHFSWNFKNWISNLRPNMTYNMIKSQIFLH